MKKIEIPMKKFKISYEKLIYLWKKFKILTVIKFLLIPLTNRFVKVQKKFVEGLFLKYRFYKNFPTNKLLLKRLPISY